MELLIVGLDGLSTNMLERYGAETPFIDGMLEEGVSGELMSVDTPTTIPAWTSFQTGLDPGSHGITNMIRQWPDYHTTPQEPNTTDPAIYDVLDDSVFVNLPASITRVPAAEDTHLVSAMMAEDKYDAVPTHLQSLDAFEEYILDHDKGKKVNPSAYFDHVIEITRARKEFAIEAFETHEPRVGFVLFSTPDWAGHLLSNFSEEGERRRYFRQLLDAVDDCAAEVADLAENVLVMSDHGFEQKHTNIHLNDWLSDNGYLTSRTSSKSLLSVPLRRAVSVLSRSDRLYEFLRRTYNYIIGTEIGQGVQSVMDTDVDHGQSKAWQLRYGCVFLNDSRFDEPQVPDGTDLDEQLRDEIAEITDADGNRVFREVLLAADAYTDPGEWAPDVIARPASGCFPTMLRSPTGEYASPTNNFNHRYRGIIAASGPLFGEGAIEGAEITDVLPTVLHALGEPLLPSFDGVILDGLLETDADPVHLDPSAVPEPRVRGDDDREKEREAAVADRLEDLGYLE